MKNKRIILLTTIFLAFVDVALAQSVIVNRGALDTLLGSDRADEGFNGVFMPLGGATRGGGSLSSTNWGNDPFTGLVVNGITFRSTHPVQTAEEYWIQWNGNDFNGIPSQNIYSSGSLLLDFWTPTLAFGIDLKDFSLYRETFIAGVRVYGADDSTLLYSANSLTLSDPVNGVFFGYQFTGGIGLIEFLTISGANPMGEVVNTFNPKIDNLSFSTAPIPEPSTFAFAVLGVSVLALRFRKL